MSSIYCLENEYLKVQISNFGGTILSFVDKKTNTDIVLGFPHLEDYYLRDGSFLGSIVGRNANRIGNGLFKLNDKEYHLDINNGPNNLHSGKDTYAFRDFEVLEYSDNQLVMHMLSKDGESGFPGDLAIDLTYKLNEKDLVLSFSGKASQDTIFNMTNHSYFNLSNEKENILNHELKIYTDKVNLNDKDGMATDILLPIKDTAFDFKDFKKIGDNLKVGHENIEIGIDHNYAFENMEDKVMAELRNEKLCLTVSSDLPGIQVYTANYLKGTKGKTKEYDTYDGVALECQFCPNSINYNSFIKPIIKKNQKVEHYIKYHLEER